MYVLAYYVAVDREEVDAVSNQIFQCTCRHQSYSSARMWEIY